MNKQNKTLPYIGLLFLLINLSAIYYLYLKKYETVSTTASAIDFTVALAIILFCISLFALFSMINITKSYLTMMDVYQANPDIVLCFDENDNIKFFNNAANKLLNISETEYQSYSISDFFDETWQNKKQRLIERIECDENENPCEFFIVNLILPNDDKIAVCASVVVSSINNSKHFICSLQIVEQLTKAIESNRAKDHELLTDEKDKFNDLLYKEIKRNARENKPLTLFRIKVAHETPHNKQLSTAINSIILQEIIDDLRSRCRAYDHLTQWEKNEFALLCPNLNINNAIDHAERLKPSIDQAAKMHNLVITVSIGMASADNEQPTTPENLIEYTEKASFLIKSEKGQAQYIQ